MIVSCRINESSSLTTRSKGKKRKIAETSNVITETLPSVEGEQVSMLAAHFQSPLSHVNTNERHFLHLVTTECFPRPAGGD